MNLITVIFIIFLFISKSLCYIGCKFDFLNESPVNGPYACQIEANETIESIDAYDLKGKHLKFSSDFDVHYIAIKSVPIYEIPKNIFSRFKNTRNFACINTSVTSLTYQNFENASNLENAWIYDNNIITIERNFLKDAKGSLNFLVLNNNKISNLASHAIGNMSNLRDLYLDRNELKTIHNNTFNGLMNLFRLSITRNLLEFIEPDAFDGLASLQVLNLDINRIVGLDKNAFKPLKRLDLLSLNYNFISYLDKELFKHFEKLAFVELRNNRLKFLSFIEALTSLVVLDITNNQVDAIKKFDTELLHEFQEFRAIENLCVNKNFSGNINSTKALDECFKNYRVPNCKYYSDKHFGPMCEVLKNSFDLEDDLPISVSYEDIKYLKVTEIYENFSFALLSHKFPNVTKILIQKSNLPHVLEQNFNCKEMRIIDIRMNNLTNLRGDIFIDCKKLEELIIIKNHIPSLPSDFLRGLENIKFIDLSFNQLHNADFDIINNKFENIVKLYLSENRFTAVPENSFEFMENLRILKLDNNKITKIDKHAFVSLRKLKELHLEHNGIEDASFLSDLIKLTYLNLEGNRIKIISNNFPTSLEYIDASFNQIENIDLQIIEKMSILNDLILTKNICTDIEVFDIKFSLKNVSSILQSCSIK